MPLPNFIGIGAQRGATTWVYRCLSEHPEVCMAKRKEVSFFDCKFDEGIAWYEDQFQPLSGQKALGEVTPTYLSYEPAAERIATVVPAARLFAILRDPVERAFSAYEFFDDWFNGMSFREACARSRMLIDFGRYARHLERFFQYFDRAQLKILLYEDVQADPAKVLAELFRFVEVSDTFCPVATTKVYNRSVMPSVQRQLAKVRLSWVVKVAKRTPLGDWVRRRKARKNPLGGHGGLKPEDRAELKGLFHEDVLRLQDMIGRDLSAWL